MFTRPTFGILEPLEVIGAGLESALTSRGLMSVGVGRDASAHPSLARHRPDLLIVDDALADLVVELSGPRIVVLADRPDGRRAAALLRAGASAYLLKSQPLDEFIDDLHRTAAGELVIASTVAEATVAALAGHSGAPEITERQRLILQSLADGAATSTIARQLGISPGTLRNGMQQIYKRLNVASRHQAVAVAWQLGLIRVPDAAGR